MNKALKREHYHLPVIEDVLPQLCDVKVYSKADLKEGFLQCTVDEESSQLTAFQNPWGRYRYKRMPFGIKPAPELFQQKLDQNLEDLSGTHIIADDILITGKGETMQEAYRDHDKNLRVFLERCRDRSIKLNKEKFNLHCEETNFIGHTLTANGLKAEPHKIEAIEKMPEPNDVPGVQRFVGMVKYLSKFLPSLSNKWEPLNRLTHKDADWHWGEEQQQAFQEIKHLVSIAPVLGYFDQRIPLEGQGDASEKGLVSRYFRIINQSLTRVDHLLQLKRDTRRQRKSC